MKIHQFWRSPSSDAALALCGVLTLGGLVVVGSHGWTSTIDRLLGRSAESMTFVLALAIVSAVVGTIGLFWTFSNRAAGVAIVIDRAGITDHRGGGVLIPWNAIHSMDTEIITVTDARTWISWHQEAKIILYVVDEGRGIKTLEVYVGGLTRKPTEVAQQVKLCWLQANAASKADVGDSSDPNRVWVG